MEVFPQLPIEDLTPREELTLPGTDRLDSPFPKQELASAEPIIKVAKQIRLNLYQLLYRNHTQEEALALLLEVKALTTQLIEQAGGTVTLPEDPFALREAYLALEGKSVNIHDEGIILFKRWSKSTPATKPQEDTQDESKDQAINTVHGEGDAVVRIVKPKPGNSYAPDSGVQEGGAGLTVPPTGLCPLCKATPQMRANNQGCDACNPS
jgi:hypothetical protein